MREKRNPKDGFIRADDAFEQSMEQMLAGYRARGEQKTVKPLRLVLVSALATLLISGALLALASGSGALDFLFSPREEMQFTYVTSYKNGVKGWVITGYYGAEGNAAVPGKIQGVPVSGIGAGAFARSMKLTGVTLPKGLAAIGDSAFFGCESLSEVIFEEGSKLQSIGNSAFAGCGSLSSLNIPESVKSVGDLAFMSCSNLLSVTLPDSLTSLGEGAFTDCERLAIIRLPEGLDKIRGGTFAGCLSLEHLEIPEGVESIGASAFYECRSLKSLTLPKGIREIPEYAFWRCEGLREITIPEGVMGIGGFAFSWCSGLTGITLPDGVAALGHEAFAWCVSLESALLPGSLTEIGEDAFASCDLLTLRGGEGSFAQQYAGERGIPFEIVHD